MLPFRFLHASDLHLDSPFKGMARVPGAIFDRLKDSTFMALENLVRTAIEENVQFVVFGGDIYDLSDRSLRAQFRFQKALETLAERGIRAYVVHGNHDPEDGAAIRLALPDTVHVFGSDQVEEVPVLTPDGRILAHVCGISYATAAVTENLAARFRPPGSSPYGIALLHTNVDGDPSHDNYAPCSSEELAQSGFHYWALGHIHKRRILREEPAIVYPGNIQGRSVKECGAKGCYVVHVSGVGSTRFSFHETDAIRWVEERISIEGLQTVQQLKERWEQSIERIRQEAGGRAAIVRFLLEGRGPVHQTLLRGTHLEEIIEEFREEEARRTQQDETYPFVWIETGKVQTQPEADLALLAEEKSFIGDLLRISQDLLRDEESLNRFAKETLAPLFENGKMKRWLNEFTTEDVREWLLHSERVAVDMLLSREADEG